MPAFHQGELLIGGMALRHLHGEIEREERSASSSTWLLSGRLHFSSDDGGRLELERQYLLRIDDGREGLVELTSMSANDGDLLADFRPRRVLPS